ncbi:MAG: hypothetical protein RMY34_34475 [Aulosira sp. DedQUE10]|nr:hypothetical protein [Aulosira sp. DedQUE10]
MFGSDLHKTTRNPWIEEVIADLKCQPVTNDEGEVISYNDFES